MTEPDESAADRDAAPSAASQLFDLRTVIAVLFGVYGIVLTIMGAFFEDEAQLTKSAGIDLNLWSGIVMIVFAALFLLWVRLRPLIPPGKRP